jgi:DNA-binding transcriptional MerR regulator
MRDSDQQDEKRYYTIGEVATMFEVNNSLIRFWEKEFEILQPKKNRKGNRLFTPKDLENLKVIYHLVKERGFTLKGAKAKLRENKEDTIRNAEIVSRLKIIRQALTEIKQGLGKDEDEH